MDALCSIKSHNASFYDVVHLWTICGLFEFSYVGFYQSPAILTIHNFFRQKQVHLSLPHFFTFNTAVVMAVWAGQNFNWSKFDYS